MIIKFLHEFGEQHRSKTLQLLCGFISGVTRNSYIDDDSDSGVFSNQFIEKIRNWRVSTPKA
jgi:hypothetical protein